MKSKATVIVFLILLFSISFLQADENAEIRKHPGYVDFSKIQVPGDAEESVEIYLQSPILKIAAVVAGNDDPGLAEMMKNLLLVKVNSFKLRATETSKITREMERIERQLNAQNWQKIVRVKGKTDKANIYLKTDDKDRIAGLVVMAIDNNNEAVFVNVVGNIDLSQVSKLGARLDIDELEEIKSKK